MRNPPRAPHPRIPFGRAATAALALLLAQPGLMAPLGGQERLAREDLPRHVADEVVDFFNDPATIRFSGRSTIPAERTVLGDVAVLGGPLTVGGAVEGQVTVVNGDLMLEPGARITGDVLVVGGRVTGDPSGVEGTLAVYGDPLRYVRRGDRIARSPRPRRPTSGPAYRGWGHSRLTIRAGTNYNRVEGLPVMFGPIIESAGPNRLRLDALGIWRTGEGFTFTDETLGYRVRLEQAFGWGSVFSLGGSVESTIHPIEDWGLTDLEASLTTFLFHKDFRDYYEREGWSAFARLRPERAPVELFLEYRDENHRFAPAESPLTLKDNDGPWRPQPMVARGELRSLGARVTVDARNDPRDPSHGWYVDARARMGVGGDLKLPALATFDGTEPGPGSEDLPARRVSTSLSSGFLDVRRYNRVGPGSVLHLRGVLGGSLDGDPLPPQLQRAIGGEGTLPGYPLFWGDCGARVVETRFFAPREDGTTASQPAFANYGCDRVAVFQAEYRSALFFDVDFGGDDDPWRGWVPRIEVEPTWAVFFNAGRGWSLSDDIETGAPRMSTGTLLDAGVGFFLGDLGLYLAVPLDDDIDRGPNFFVRLSHRF